MNECKCCGHYVRIVTGIYVVVKACCGFATFNSSWTRKPMVPGLVCVGVPDAEAVGKLAEDCPFRKGGQHQPPYATKEMGYITYRNSGRFSAIRPMKMVLYVFSFATLHRRHSDVSFANHNV